MSDRKAEVEHLIASLNIPLLRITKHRIFKLPDGSLLSLPKGSSHGISYNRGASRLRRLNLGRGTA
jgi:hypothetical protein